MTRDRFEVAHRALAEIGACDATGGMEYQRVKHEWIACGRPPEIRSFIRFRANCSADNTWRAGPGAWMLLRWRGADGLIHHASKDDRLLCRWDLMPPGHEERTSSTVTCLACVALDGCLE